MIKLLSSSLGDYIYRSRYINEKILGTGYETDQQNL